MVLPDFGDDVDEFGEHVDEFGDDVDELVVWRDLGDPLRPMSL